MKIVADSVICRIADACDLISVTHTSKDQSGRRVNDIHSVADLLLALPTLTAPIVEAIPYEVDYYDKWARVTRSEATSRGSIRPVTVTVKSWTLLHSVPPVTQTTMDAPASPRRQPAGSNGHKASITSCKSLDSIIEQYNQMFPNESEQKEKCNVKAANNKAKTTQSSEKGTVKLHLNHKQSISSENLPTTDYLTPNSNHHIPGDNKYISRDLSPKRKLSVSSVGDRSSASPDRSIVVDKSSKKNTLQVPLPTGLVCIQWPNALPASDSGHKSTQFPICSPKKNSNQIVPRIKTPDLHLSEQGASTSQLNNTAGTKQVGELKLMQISSSSLVASHSPRRNSFERRANNTTRVSPDLSPDPRSTAFLRRYSTQSNVTLSTENTLDYRSPSTHEPNICELDTFSPGRKCISGDLLHPQNKMCTLKLPVDVLVPLTNSQREASQERQTDEVQSVCTNTGNKSDIMTTNAENEPKFCRKKRHKFLRMHENTKHSSDERGRSSKSTQPKHRNNAPPMVQFLDYKDLHAIFDKAAKVRRP